MGLSTLPDGVVPGFALTFPVAPSCGVVGELPPFILTFVVTALLVILLLLISSFIVTSLARVIPSLIPVVAPGAIASSIATAVPVIISPLIVSDGPIFVPPTGVLLPQFVPYLATGLTSSKLTLGFEPVVPVDPDGASIKQRTVQTVDGEFSFRS